MSVEQCGSGAGDCRCHRADVSGGPAGTRHRSSGGHPAVQCCDAMTCHEEAIQTLTFVLVLKDTRVGPASGDDLAVDSGARADEMRCQEAARRQRQEVAVMDSYP